MNKTIVIGGGAAGMMAAVFAARNGQAVTLYEQNENLGKKLLSQERADVMSPMMQRRNSFWLM